MAPSADKQARIRALADAAARRLIFGDGRPMTSVLVACSAGPDSVALVRAIHALASVRDLRVEIAHVNHRLRGKESERDEAFVRRLAADLGLRLRVLARPVPPGPGNLEERARDLRYAALLAIARRAGLEAVATAHSAEDQAETVVMNLLRGSGLEGLGGMAPVRIDARSGVAVVRPFLALPRADIRAALDRRGYRIDRTNRDVGFLRNYVRLKLFSQLDRRLPGFQLRIARAAGLLRDEREAMAQAGREATRKIARTYKGGWLLDGRTLARYPLAVQRRVLRQVAGNDLLTFDGVERLRTWMASPPTSGRIWQLRKGWIVERLSKARGFSSPSLFWFRQAPSGNNRFRTLGSKKGR